jgi:hypothetical protein
VLQLVELRSFNVCELLYNSCRLVLLVLLCVGHVLWRSLAVGGVVMVCRVVWSPVLSSLLLVQRMC